MAKMVNKQYFHVGTFEQLENYGLVCRVDRIKEQLQVL